MNPEISKPDFSIDLFIQKLLHRCSQDWLIKTAVETDTSLKNISEFRERGEKKLKKFKNPLPSF
jgi:hypothetical protein